jgi:hypothetical protein
MDVLVAMFRSMEQASMLAEILSLGLKHLVSLCADDIVVFARPSEDELVAIREILVCFGVASGLAVNFAKGSIAHILYPEALLAGVTQVLQCPMRLLPCTYLSLPLSIQVLTKAELQPVLEKLGNKLAFWKARLMSRTGESPMFRK